MGNNIGFLLISSTFCLPSLQGDYDAFKLFVGSIIEKVKKYRSKYPQRLES